MSVSPPPNPHPRARIIGPGLVVTLENPIDRFRTRVRIARREGREVLVHQISDGNRVRGWSRDGLVILRSARPFGLFLYRARMAEVSQDGTALLRLEDDRPRRRQLRGYFRMPVRLGIMLETEPGEPTVILRARNLSGSGVLVYDPESILTPRTAVRVGLPVGNSGELLRLPARVVRIQEGPPRRAALWFDSISEGARQMLLRYLVRQHRRRQGETGEEGNPKAEVRVLPLERP
jgi:hypothetical protein